MTATKVMMEGKPMKCLRCPGEAFAKKVINMLFIYECKDCARVYAVQDITALYDELDDDLKPIRDEGGIMTLTHVDTVGGGGHI